MGVRRSTPLAGVGGSVAFTLALALAVRLDPRCPAAAFRLMLAEEGRARGRPGPRRPEGAPVGRGEVRRAVLDAAATLFALRGVDAVSLRDIASAANVQLSLIREYVGNRDELVMAVFDDLSDQMAQAVLDRPLLGHGFEPDTVMGKWTRVAASLVLSGARVAGRPGFNPVLSMAKTIEDGYGLDPKSARLRAAQIVGAGLGWRIFEAYLIEAGELDDFPVETLRDELVRSHRRTGVTPWPSPPDPTPRPR